MWVLHIKVAAVNISRRMQDTLTPGLTLDYVKMLGLT